MSYYQGDFYRGDYYGDPFIGGFFKKIGKTIGGGIKGLLTGGPLGAVSGAVSGAFGSTTPAPPPRFTTTPILQMPTERRTTSIGPGGMIYKREMTEYGGGVTGLPGGGDGCPKGFHLNKANSPRGPKGSYCVKNRRMNVTNPKALRRAIRRNRGFVKTFRKAAGSVGMVVYAKRSPSLKKRR